MHPSKGQRMARSQLLSLTQVYEPQVGFSPPRGNMVHGRQSSPTGLYNFYLGLPLYRALRPAEIRGGMFIPSGYHCQGHLLQISRLLKKATRGPIKSKLQREYTWQPSLNDWITTKLSCSQIWIISVENHRKSRKGMKASCAHPPPTLRKKALQGE